MEINLQEEFQDINIKLEALTQANRALCLRLSSFLGNGPAIGATRAVTKSLEKHRQNTPHFENSEKAPL